MSRVQSIERAFAVLGALADGPIGVTEVADRADLPKSTAARLLASLAREGVVEQVPGDTRYRLGPRLVDARRAGSGRAASLATLARPSLAALAATAGEAAGLCDPRRRRRPLHRPGRTRRTRSRSATGPARGSRSTRSRPARSCSPSGRRRPCSATSAGRWSAFTPRTIVTGDALLERLRAIRRDGYAWAREEFDEGISSVAAPVADATGEVVAAVHVHGPSYRFPVAGHGGRDIAGAGRRDRGPDLRKPPARGLGTRACLAPAQGLPRSRATLPLAGFHASISTPSLGLA